MRICQVIGKVVLSKAHESLTGARYVLAVPLMLDELVSMQDESGLSDSRNEELVVYDELGACRGCLIAISEGGEAAQPFLPNYKPVDAYNAAILDDLNIGPDFTK